MSTATIPFTHRNGFFPFCSGSTTLPTNGVPGYNYDSVDFTASGGDEGFAQAFKFFWMLERLQFTPTGTTTIGADTASFTKVFSGPLPDTSNLLVFRLSGAYVGFSVVANNGGGLSGSVFTSTSQAFVEPVLRVCQSSYCAAAQFLYDLAADQTATYEFWIVYESSKWRLYYRFNFGNSLASITNSANTGALVITTGTMTIDGLSLGWVANSSSVASIDSGYGLSGSATFLTF